VHDVLATGAQPGRQRTDVALDDDVQLAGHAPEQQVAHRAADDVHAVHARRRLEQAPAAWQLPQALAQIVHGDSLSRAPDRRTRRPRCLPWLP
jgi:hypothetical protein